MENVKKNRDETFATIKAKSNYLVSETNYYTTKLFFQKLY